MRQPSQKKMQRANKYVTAALRKLGALYVPEYYGNDDLVIKTVAGLLTFHPYGTWVACRFEDVQAARDHFHVGEHETGNRHHLNPYSGKWNWHWSTVPTAADLDFFLDAVRALLPTDKPKCMGCGQDVRPLYYGLCGRCRVETGSRLTTAGQ
jgi:hypothetical protein